MNLVLKICILLLVAIPFSTFSQEEGALDISFRESEVYKTEYKTHTIDHRHGDNNGGAYQVLQNSRNNSEYVLQHINAELIINKSVEMDLGKERITSSFVIDKRFHFITGVINKSTREIMYKAYYTDDYGASYQEKSFLSIPIELLGVEIGLAKFLNPLMPSFKDNSTDKDGSGFISFSRDKNFFVVSFDVFESKKDEHLFYVFSKDFELVFEASFVSDEKDRNFNFIDIQVDDRDGTLYYLAKVIEKRSFLTGIRDYRFEVVKIDARSTSVSSFEEEGISFGVIRLRIDKWDGSLKAIGTYSEKGDAFDRGVVLVAFNPNDLNSFEVTRSPFSDEFLELKFGKKKNKELKNYFLKGILQRDNGNFVMTSEEIRVIDRSKEFGQVSSPYYFHFKDILLAEISREGELIRANHINKHQEITNLTYQPIASYSGFIKGDDTYLLLNAQKVKEKKNKPDLFSATSLIPHRIFLLKIDGEGVTTYQQIEKSETRMLFASGEAMFTVDDGASASSLLLQGQTLNKRQFMKIDFPE